LRLKDFGGKIVNEKAEVAAETPVFDLLYNLMLLPSSKFLF